MLQLTRHKYFRPGLAAVIVVMLVGGLVALNPEPERDAVSTTAKEPEAQAEATNETVEPEALPAEEAPLAEPGVTVPGRAGARRAGPGSTPAAAPSSAPSGAPGTPAATAAGCGFAGCETARGITDTTIKLGFYVLEGGDEAFAAFGVAANLGDQKRQAQILVDDINARGGIAGRKVVPVFVKQQAASSDPPGDIKRACVTFAEDQKVFAVVPDGQLQGADLRKCLGQRHTYLIGPAGQATDSEALAGEIPWSVLPNAKAIDRGARSLIPALTRQGYFSKWAPQGVIMDVKVGLITYDDPGFARTADKVVKPILAEKGIPVEEVRLNAADVSQAQSQMQQAVLRFKGTDVTHVMFLPGRDAFFFYQSAESQQYRPRYAVDSNAFPNLMETAAPAQAKGAMGIGWAPSFDVSLTDPKRHPFSEQEKRCFALMQKGGENARDRSSRAGNFCDMVWLFEAAATKAGRDLTAGSFYAGMRAMGSWDFLGFPTDFTKGTADSSYSHRLLAFDDGDCKCFTYRSGPLSDQ